LRPFSGSCCTARCSITCPVSALALCTSGAAAVTSTVSVTLPTLRVKSTRICAFTVTTMSRCSAFLNPGCSTVTRYVPRIRKGTM